MAKNFLARAKSWAARHKLLGPQAFLKYVMFTYLDALNRETEEFVFKGGNLLWAYIETPRATVDLDLSTLEEDDDGRVRSLLERASRGEGITFRLENFEPSEQGGKRGASVTIAYKTDSGASNKFGIDVAYATPVDIAKLTSPVNEDEEIQAASIENIIADKLRAVQRFGSGNTRMKDFDDLWRIAKSGQQIDSRKLGRILSARKTDRSVDPSWISGPMRLAWKSHRARYKDLPQELEDLFREVNWWLGG